ncbi:MAG: glycosyltransferase family 2 protein [Phycisphaeraceae bacterium]|nr:MAG: glycosyltransferase family 2 protein [Phycisphaeraceae bacterium]
MLVGVVIPVYNERVLLPRLLERLDATPRPLMPDGSPATRHIFLVDDGSTDGTVDLLPDYDQREDVTCLYTDKNRGKGSALRRGFAAALDKGCDAVIVQDADLEYNPADQATALAPILDGQADAVIGTRFLGESHRVLYYWHSVVNKGITALSNMLSNLNLTDIECGTKAFTHRVLAEITPKLREDRFGIEPELIARLARLRLPPADAADQPARPIRIFEVPISYAGRTYEEGKKIGWRDGLEAVRCIVHHNFLA